jgi:hypothetical protein
MKKVIRQVTDIFFEGITCIDDPCRSSAEYDHIRDQSYAIYLLQQNNMNVHRSACQLNVSINTVQSITEQQGQIPKTIRKEKVKIDPDLFTRLYSECKRPWAAGFLKVI